VQPPSRRGFGTTIIERSVPFDLKGDAEIRFDLLGVQALRLYPAEVDQRPARSALWSEESEYATQRALILRAATIYGGSLQIQRNIIAKVAFDL
jgi:hypothetical protein